MARRDCCGARRQRWLPWTSSTQNCITCHNGNNNISPALSNVYAEFSKTSYHPFPSGTNTHDTAEAILLNNNRHAIWVSLP